MLPRKFLYCNSHVCAFSTIFKKILFECFSKYDAFCSHIVNLCLLKALGLLLSKRFEIMEKLYLRKTFFKMAGGGMHPLHPLWIHSCGGEHSLNCKSHQKSLAYFSHLETFCPFTKRQSQKQGPLHDSPLNASLK